MAEENQTFDDIIDSIEIADEEIIDPDEEVVETTPEDDDAEVEEQSDEPTTTDDEVVDPYARFSETGNVNDLPEGATKDKLIAESQRAEQMVRAANERFQEAAGLRKQQEQQKPPKEEPVIDWENAAPHELKEQHARHQAWQRESMQSEFDTKLSQTQQQVNQILLQQQTADLTNFASTLDGMTPEMDKAMEAVVKADPSWGEFLTSKGGIKKLFDYTKAQQSVETRQDATARQARKVAKASEPKAPSQKAEAPSVNEEIKGMGDWDALDHITQSVVYDT